MIKKVCVFLFSIIILFSCDKIGDEIVNNQLSSIEVSGISAPDTVSFSSDSTLTTSIIFKNSETVSDVWFKLYTTDGSVSISNFVQMTDDGSRENGDDFADDNLFSGKISLTQDFPYGFYNIEYFVRSNNNAVNKVAVHKFLYDNGQFNIPPELLNISAPDSITIENETVVFLIEAEVIDSNGLADIASVWFITTRPDSSSSGIQNFLNDSGDDGDLVKGDGIYSSNFIAPPNAVADGIWHFDFQAIDRRQNFSNVLRHSIKIQNK